MKKLLSVSAMALVLLAGCSSTTSYAGESAPSTEEGKEGEITTVTFDKSGDDITNTSFDIVFPEATGDSVSTTSKKELDAAGEYGMEKASSQTWTEHVTDLETYVNDNDAFPTLNDEGLDADGASGATIHLTTFKEAFDNATEVA